MQPRHGYGYTADAGLADPQRALFVCFKRWRTTAKKTRRRANTRLSLWSRLAEIPDISVVEDRRRFVPAVCP
jgi:hypothetical protein